MIAEKTWLKNGDKIVAPFTTIDCIVDNDGKAFVESAESITQNTNAVANIGDYLGVDVSKKRNLFNIKSTFGAGGNNTYSYDGRTLTVNGAYYMAFGVSVNPNTYYCLSVASIVGTVYGMVQAWGDSSATDNIGTVNSGTPLVFNSGSRTKIWLGVYSGNATSGTTTVSDIMLNEGSEPQPYVPYVPTLNQVPLLNSLNVAPTYTSIVTSVAEYLRYSKYGKIVVVDVGGVIFNANGMFITGLPVMKTRPVVTLMNDMDGTPVACAYGFMGDGTIGVNVFSNKQCYGQIVYLTD